MQQSGGLLLAAGWTAATQLFSFLAGMKMQTNPSIAIQNFRLLFFASR